MERLATHDSNEPLPKAGGVRIAHRFPVQTGALNPTCDRCGLTAIQAVSRPCNPCGSQQLLPLELQHGYDVITISRDFLYHAWPKP